MPALAASPTETVTVRNSSPDDVPAIRDIYAHHVLNGLASFEETPPTVDDMAARREGVLKLGLPYLVAELNGRVVGYSYASSFRPRPAYRHTVENSVYVADGMHGHGIGGTLLKELIRRCEAGMWRQMIAVIGNSENFASITLHKRHGFRLTGILEGTGFKHGRWVDTVLMQRALGPGVSTLPSTIPTAPAA